MEPNVNSSHRKGKIDHVPRPPSRVRTTGRETVEFSVRGPLPVNIDEEPVTIPGCSILDLVFSGGGAVVGEVTFRNYYTASVSVLVKCAPPPPTPLPANSRPQSAVSGGASASAGEWKLAIAKKELMPQPHLEHGSHSLVSVVVTESTVEWNSLLAIRLVLRQPSPVWRVFHVEELNVYADLPRLSMLKSDIANFTNFNSQQQNHQQHYDKMLNLVRRQTLAALSWLPPEPPSSASNAAPPPSIYPPITSHHKATCGYELTKLPQI